MPFLQLTYRSKRHTKRPSFKALFFHARATYRAHVHARTIRVALLLLQPLSRLGVNFTNILQAAFAPISFRKK